jgi:hypothetical protein
MSSVCKLKCLLSLLVTHTQKPLCSLAHSLPCSFPRTEGEKNEIYLLTIVGRASNVGNRVGSGSGSRYRAGACIYRGRVLPEGSKGKDESFLNYQLSLAG